jgi:diguanylate cyclase (GGDEF)-like protein
VSVPARLSAFLDRLPRLVTFATCLGLVAGVGVLDTVIGGNVTLSIFYAVPISIATWVFGWRAERTGAPLSLAIFDVDDLKLVNDRYGHAAGNALLVAVARAWAAALRRTDLVARLGGDESAVLMPHTDEEAARVALEVGRSECLAAIAAGAWPALVSSGAVTCGRGVVDVETLLRHADSMMYEAKAAGKDGIRTGSLGSTPRQPVRSPGPGPGRMAST